MFALWAIFLEDSNFEEIGNIISQRIETISKVLVQMKKDGVEDSNISVSLGNREEKDSL